MPAPATHGASVGADALQRAVNTLRSTETVRARAHHLLARARADESEYFTVDDAALPPTAALVAEVTRQRYPTLAIPYHSRWRHFEVGGVNRRAWLDERLVHATPPERARALIHPPARRRTRCRAHSFCILSVTANLNSPQRQLIALRIEHADLDAIIDRLADQTPLDQLTLQRMKKRRLALRDKVARLEAALDPREPA